MRVSTRYQTILFPMRLAVVKLQIKVDSLGTHCAASNDLNLNKRIKYQPVSNSLRSTYLGVITSKFSWLFHQFLFMVNNCHLSKLQLLILILSVRPSSNLSRIKTHWILISLAKAWMAEPCLTSWTNAHDRSTTYFLDGTQLDQMCTKDFFVISLYLTVVCGSAVTTG